MIEEYRTIKKQAEGFFKDKGSKFLAFAYPYTDELQAKKTIEELRKRNPGACHVCFAWRFGIDDFHDRYSDDGEPNNSAGKPIFGQLLSFEVTNVMIAVVRYYGGTNLGVGGLVTAYKSAAKDALENAKIIVKTVDQLYLVNYDYAETGQLMSLLNKFDVNIIEQGYDTNSPFIRFSTPIKFKQQLFEELESMKSVRCKLID